MTAGETTANVTDREIIISRLFDAPRGRVWRALTDSDLLKQWWGPRGFRNTIHEADIRPGGKLVFTMHGPDGTDYPNEMRYVEMVEPERIRISHDGLAGKLKPFDQEITLEDVGGKTRLTLKNVFESPEELRKQVDEVGAVEGGKQTLERLAEFLKQGAKA
jgi:uncharacterized protein YndB with AHSA1/START domain